MRSALPDDVVAYKRTAIFDQNSIPAGLRRRHATREGTWALVVVLEGRLVLRFLDGGPERLLDAQTPGVIEPQQPHEVEPAGPVSFFVEFYDRAHASAERAETAAHADAAMSAMGFAGKAELATFLNELLEAERAGSRVTLQSARATPAPALSPI